MTRAHAIRGTLHNLGDVGCRGGHALFHAPREPISLLRRTDRRSPILAGSGGSRRSCDRGGGCHRARRVDRGSRIVEMVPERPVHGVARSPGVSVGDWVHVSVVRALRVGLRRAIPACRGGWYCHAARCGGMRFRTSIVTARRTIGLCPSARRRGIRRLRGRRGRLRIDRSARPRNRIRRAVVSPVPARSMAGRGKTCRSDRGVHLAVPACMGNAVRRRDGARRPRRREGASLCLPAARRSDDIAADDAAFPARKSVDCHGAAW